MKLSKEQRATLKMKFGGRCAYCGVPLGDRWHADHLEPVHRESQIQVRDNRLSFKSGPPTRPELDTIENLMPACQPCNTDKSVYDIEAWRAKLQRSCDVLMRNHALYRHALRFGMVSETNAPVQFYFERAAAQGDGDGR